MYVVAGWLLFGRDVRWGEVVSWEESGFPGGWVESGIEVEGCW